MAAGAAGESGAGKTVMRRPAHVVRHVENQKKARTRANRNAP